MPHGVLDATLDPAVLRRGLALHPHANLGVRLDGLVAVDVDTRSWGHITLDAFEQTLGPLPRSLRTHTGQYAQGRGQHIILSDPDGVPWRSTLGEGLELRGGADRYIVVPPSRHVSGVCYRGQPDATPRTSTLSGAPDWLSTHGRRRGPELREHGAPVAPALDSFAGAAFEAAGLIGVEFRDGKIGVRCPQRHLHSSGTGFGQDSSCVLLPPEGDARLGAFRCAHAHCSDLTTFRALALLPKAAIATAALRFPLAYRGFLKGLSNG
jgi:hypothetical protein